MLDQLVLIHSTELKAERRGLSSTAAGASFNLQTDSLASSHPCVPLSDGGPQAASPPPHVVARQGMNEGALRKDPAHPDVGVVLRHHQGYRHDQPYDWHQEPHQGSQGCPLNWIELEFSHFYFFLLWTLPLPRILCLFGRISPGDLSPWPHSCPDWFCPRTFLSCHCRGTQNSRPCGGCQRLPECENLSSLLLSADWQLTDLYVCRTGAGWQAGTSNQSTLYFVWNQNIC